MGHRGAAGLAAENTLRALEEAIRVGADAAEFDVQSTRDGVLVASHDPVIVTDSGERVNIREATYSELKVVRVSGEPVPRIEELLDAARNRIGLLLEVKEPRDTHRLVKLLVKCEALGYAALISFYDEVITAARRVEPRIVTGLLYYTPPGRIGDAKRLGCQLVLPRYQLATPKAIAFAHKLGLKVVAWTINDKAWMKRLVERRIDAIATDYPDQAANLRKELVQRSQ